MFSILATVALVVSSQLTHATPRSPIPTIATSAIEASDLAGTTPIRELGHIIRHPHENLTLNTTIHSNATSASVGTLFLCATFSCNICDQTIDLSAQPHGVCLTTGSPFVAVTVTTPGIGSSLPFGLFFSPGGTGGTCGTLQQVFAEDVCVNFNGKAFLNFALLP